MSKPTIFLISIFFFSKSIAQVCNGTWAPSFRYHDGFYYIFWGDPDFEIYMTKAKHPAKKWTTPHLVKAAKV